MVRSKKTISMSLALAIVIIMGVFTSSSYAMASETRDSNLANVTEESSGSEIVPFGGTETLKIGDYYIGKFTFI